MGGLCRARGDGAGARVKGVRGLCVGDEGEADAVELGELEGARSAHLECRQRQILGFVCVCVCVCARARVCVDR